MRANIIRYFSCKTNQFMSMYQLQFCQASEWQVCTHNLPTHFPQSTCPSCHHSSLYYKSSKTPLCSQEGLTNQQSALLCRPLRESDASKNACSLTEECLIIFLSGLGLGTESKDYQCPALADKGWDKPRQSPLERTTQPNKPESPRVEPRGSSLSPEFAPTFAMLLSILNKVVTNHPTAHP